MASDISNSKKIGGNDKPKITMTGNRLMMTLIRSVQVICVKRLLC